MRISQLVNATVAALEDIKARDIVVLDVRRTTTMFDRIIIASADSSRQGKALANNVQERLKVLGAKIYGVEGAQTGEWILIDLGQIVVHIMQPAIRKYYNLEELWAPPSRARRKKAPASAS